MIEVHQPPAVIVVVADDGQKWECCTCQLNEVAVFQGDGTVKIDLLDDCPHWNRPLPRPY